MNLPATEQIFDMPPISPILEMGAYEHLWLQPKAGFKAIAELFEKTGPDTIPTDLVDPGIARKTADEVMAVIKQSEIGEFGIRVHGAYQYPQKLRDAKYPVELLYFRGAWELTETSCVAVVGSRKASEDGKRRAAVLVKQLVENGYTVVSGLAAGIDTAAHNAAIEAGGRTISVIGTPITDYYPRENRDLQNYIAENHLLISQIPILRYKRQNPSSNRFFFPERNKTMSALTLATIIVEASDTSGTLIQARAAMEQGRQIFILDSCFENPNITWPARLEKKGAVRVSDMEDIKWLLDVE